MLPNSKPSFLKQSHAIYTLNQAELSRLCCPMCDGIVFEPCQCKHCEKVYCGPHVKEGMKCVICRESKWGSIFEIDKFHKTSLLNIKMRCDCTSQLFRYTEYIQHFAECEKESIKLGHNYRCFFVITEDGRVPLSELQNIVLNVNINNEQKELQLEMFSYDLVKLRRTSFCPNRNQSIEETLEYQRHNNHRPFVIWCVDLQDNHFTPYDNQNQRLIEKAYKEYNKNSDLSQLVLRIGGQEKRINFTTMVQFNPETSYSRKITREIV